MRAVRRDPEDPTVRQALESLARGSDLVFPSRFRKWLRDFRQVGGVGDQGCVMHRLMQESPTPPFSSVVLG